MESYNLSERCKPYPELAEVKPERKPFKIHDSREIPGPVPDGMVDLVERRICVPLVPRGRAVVRHEMGHVRWSPTKLPDTGVDPQIVLAVEDARVNLALENSGIPVELEARGRAQVVALATVDIDERRYAAVVLRAVASIGTNVERPLRDSAQGAPQLVADFTRRTCSRVRRRLRDAARRAGSHCAPFATAEALAREIERDLAALGFELPQSNAGPCCLGRMGIGSGEDSDGETLAGILSRRRGRGRGRGAGGGVQPGEMSTVVAPLDAPTGRGQALVRSSRPASEGSAVRFVHRFSIDGRIFRRRSRGRAGTVLVDTSGSMSLDADDLDRILRETWGAAQVAIYSGKGSRGELRIVARGGRRAAARHLKPFGGGNIVDVPALEWLTRQPQPRIWISDGGVSGVGDSPSAEIRRRCKQLVARARVQRVKDVEAAVRVLRGQKCGQKCGKK
ncbi:MAG: hypothetical protein V3T22_14035 [Planctomycetota bacterium]